MSFDQLVMLVTVYETRWFSSIAPGRISLDPTRMAQGIMTGIGFLGAGTIIKDGLSVRGLTTAASIWITAAIGILIGIGFYFPAAVATILTLGYLVRLSLDREPNPRTILCSVRDSLRAQRSHAGGRDAPHVGGLRFYDSQLKLSARRGIRFIRVSNGDSNQ